MIFGIKHNETQFNKNNYIKHISLTTSILRKNTLQKNFTQFNVHYDSIINTIQGWFVRSKLRIKNI